MRIFIVEDHPGIRFALEIALELEGYEIVAFERGEDALARLSREDSDLVLLDLNTDGIAPEEFMHRLMAIYGTSTRVRPVVGVLSAVPNLESRVRDLGADFFFQKPFEMSEFLSYLSGLEQLQKRAIPAGFAS